MLVACTCDCDQLVTVRKISRKIEKVLIFQDIIHYQLFIVYTMRNAGKKPVKNQYGKFLYINIVDCALFLQTFLKV